MLHPVLRVGPLGLALGAAFLLLPARDVRGFTTNGNSLNQQQRDVRVFDNFPGSLANDNNGGDPEFPGYNGAELAIWKAVVEWGSGLHGTGYGDPHQPGDLGSGHANFDPSWQGLATAVGNANSNTFSVISTTGFGVYAYTEFPSTDGWRIRFHANWIWEDGPELPIFGVDIQGVAAHEYGHALGLGESPVAGATMSPTLIGNGYEQRSIEADDASGLQSIYGTPALVKPSIFSANGVSMLTIVGEGFAATNNEVWFTQAGVGGSGTPVKATGLSSNGTFLLLPVPANAGPGDILVKRGGVSGNGGLSNAYPFDPSGSTSCDATLYCTAKINSLNAAPYVFTAGTPSSAADSFFIVADSAGIGNVAGVPFFGRRGPRAHAWKGGTLCAEGPLERLPPLTFDPFGVAQVQVDVGPNEVGLTRWFQFWFRDPQHPDGTGIGLTDAVQVTTCF